MKRKPPPRQMPPAAPGKPDDLSDLIDRIRQGTLPAMPAAPQAPAAPAAAPGLTDADVEQVFDALVLAGCRRGRTWLMQFMRQLEWRTTRGAYFSAQDLQLALPRLAAARRVRAVDGMGWDVAPQQRIEPLARLLRTLPRGLPWRAWANASATYAIPGQEPATPALRDADEMVAYARLVLYGDITLQRLQRLSQPPWGPRVSGRELGLALTSPLLPDLFDALPAEVRNALLQAVMEAWPPGSDVWLLLFPHVQAWADRAPAELAAPLRLTLADRCIHRGDLDKARQLLQGLADDPHTPVLHAAIAARQGRWQQAADGFEAALKVLGKASKLRRGLVPYRTLQWYLWSLLALPDPAAWTRARKLAVAESGSRTPQPQGWGLAAYAIAVRLGDERLLDHLFMPTPGGAGVRDSDDQANTLLLAAWLGCTPRGWTPALLKELVQGLVKSERPWKADLVRQACERLGLVPPPRLRDEGPPWAAQWLGAAPEAWRDALAAIQALGVPKGASSTAAAAQPTLIWRLQLDRHGRVRSVVPFEQAMGARGPLKPRELKLSALQRNKRLDPRDAAVARCIRVVPWSRRTLQLDRSAATQALVGHPRVELADAPGQTVDLVDSVPLLELRRQQGADGSEHFVFELIDPVLPPPEVDDDDDEADIDDEDDFAEVIDPDDLAGGRNDSDSLRIVRDGSDRARLLRITPAQRRVAELVSQRWTVPASAQAELDAALRVLAGHFQLHSDAAAGQDRPSESRLRAQLSPQGDTLQLRLVVRPFGDFGPEVAPGQGRERLLTVHQGLNLATRRALAQEAAHLAELQAALPFLGDNDGDNRWLLDDPEQALTVVERLPTLAGVVAVEWPKGQPVRVLTPQAQALSLQVGSGRDWLHLDGTLQLDEQRVLGLQQLLQLMAAGRGRFVALGDGEYLALTTQLRRQLDDLQTLVQPDGTRLKLPAVAASWLAELTQGVALQGDAAWARQQRLLDEAAALQPQPPATLQAELRPYQVEGYAWMVRLAHAGLGGCLADDMGLGKTVQTLALLLQRAALGPALVLAPTSVCANWCAEAARFAPSLQVLDYGSERAAALAGAGPGRVVVVSYALASQDIEALSAQRWATLVLDEAQALKNAATQRARSVAALDAGFRLALSGTPVENRLADLWSLMNLLNPGLLGSATRFAERWATPIERDRDEAARQRLRRLVSPFLLRRTKAQVLNDLPPRTEIVHRVEPSADERAFLEALRRRAVDQVARAGANGKHAAMQVLAELTRLRRAACDPRLVEPGLGLVGAKLREFELLATELVAGRHKALVFSQFTDFLDLLAERLRALGIGFQHLDGSTPAAARAERVAAFQRGDGELFLISLKAGGFGLNLTAADYVIIVDPWWNPAAEDQAMGRAHRIGQQRPVTVYRLVTAGSIEERIVALHRDKRSLADGILADQDDARALTTADLKLLLDDVSSA
jgi:superfamily II DNA or RNA helicase